MEHRRSATASADRVDPLRRVHRPGAVRARRGLLRDRRWRGPWRRRLPDQPRGRAAVRRRAWREYLDRRWEATGLSRPVRGGRGRRRARARWRCRCWRRRPACAAALRYVLVERSEDLRRASPSTWRWGTPSRCSDRRRLRIRGPGARPGRARLLCSLEDLPVEPFDGVVIANELLDNVAVPAGRAPGRRLARGAGRPRRRPSSSSCSVPLDERERPALDQLRARRAARARGCRCSRRRCDWLRRALSIAGARFGRW